MFKKIHILFFMLLFSVTFLYAQEEQQEQNENTDLTEQEKSFKETGRYLFSNDVDTTITNYITYDAYIESIKRSLPSIQLNLLDIESSEVNLMREKGTGDVNLRADLGAVGTQGQTMSLLPIAPSSGIGIGRSIGAGSLIPYSGTRWQLSLTNTTMFYNDPKGARYQPTINLTVSQPILRNFFGMADRYRIEDARFAIDITRDTSMLSNNNLLVAYQKIYYQWIGLEKSLQGIDSALLNAKNVEGRTLRRYRSGLIDNDSYQQSKAQTFQYMDMVTQYREQVISLINTLKFFITNTGIIRPDHQQWDVDLERAIGEKPEFIPFNQSSYGRLASKNGERIANNIAIQENLTMPDLSIVAGVGVGADDSSGYFNSISKMTNVDYFVGFKFSYPIGNRASKANLKDAEISLEKFNMQYRNMVLDYNTRMRNSILRYNAITDMLDTKKNRIKSLESALKTQMTKYNQGRIELIDVIETENLILTEKLNLNDLEYQLINNYYDYKELFTVTHTIN